jgi:hypothetical protein
MYVWVGVRVAGIAAGHAARRVRRQGCRAAWRRVERVRQELAVQGVQRGELCATDTVRGVCEGEPAGRGGLLRRPPRPCVVHRGIVCVEVAARLWLLAAGITTTSMCSNVVCDASLTRWCCANASPSRACVRESADAFAATSSVTRLRRRFTYVATARVCTYRVDPSHVQCSAVALSLNPPDCVLPRRLCP